MCYRLKPCLIVKACFSFSFVEMLLIHLHNLRAIVYLYPGTCTLPQEFGVSTYDILIHMDATICSFNFISFLYNFVHFILIFQCTSCLNKYMRLRMWIKNVIIIAMYTATTHSALVRAYKHIAIKNKNNTGMIILNVVGKALLELLNILLTILYGRLHVCTQLHHKYQVISFAKSDLNGMVIFSVVLHE